MAETERKLQNFLNRVEKESDRKRDGPHCKKTEIMSNIKRKITRLELQTGDVNMKQLLKFKVLRSVLTEDRK